MALAARSPNLIVRVATAAGVANLGEEKRVEPLDSLLSDAEAGVRKAATRSAARLRLGGLRHKLQQIERSDPEGAVRRLAREALAGWPEPS